MIYKEALTNAQKEKSRKNYNIFNLVNGASYMCLGETVLILFAVRLSSPDYVIAILGSMIYFGFLLLPLGKVMTARVGAAASQANFWVCRNISALAVAASAPVAIWINSTLAIVMVVVGAFFFYGFRAAGVVMSQPLIGEISEESTRGKFIALSTMLFYVAGLVGLLVISLLLYFSQSVWMLSGIIVAGAVIGVTASRFIRQIDETDQIRESARKPLRSQLKSIIKDQLIHRQLVSGMVVNLGVILTVPISMLALKRGYMISDTEALLFSLLQFGAMAAGSYGSGVLLVRVGPRKGIIISYWLLGIIALFWIFAPSKLNVFLLSLPFLLGGSAVALITNSTVLYYLLSVEKSKQVAASMLISVATGAGAGIIGMILGGGLLKLIDNYYGSSYTALETYRIYFIAVLVVIVLLSFFVHRLVKIIDHARREHGEAKVNKIIRKVRSYCGMK